MRIIECDICTAKIEPFTQADLTETMEFLLEKYTNLRNPDICDKCLDNLSNAIKEAIIQWKLKKGKK